MDDLDWDDLRYLLALRRHGSLAGAARALAVNQTTAGRRLTALETRLGTRLFERQATGHRLTTPGHRACELATAMEEAARAVDRELRGRDVGIEGTVRITAPGGFVHLLAPALAKLHAIHPGLSVDLTVDTVALDLVKREADLALRMAHSAQASLVAKRLGQLPWALFASDAYLRSRGAPPADLVGHSIIAYDAPLSRSPGGTWLAEHATRARVAMRTNNVVSALECAAAGLGIVAAPTFLARRERSLEPLPKPREIGVSPVFLVTQRDVAKVPRVRAVIDHVVASLRAQPEILRR